jgi:hypothetical protein
VKTEGSVSVGDIVYLAEAENEDPTYKITTRPIHKIAVIVPGDMCSRTTREAVRPTL